MQDIVARIASIPFITSSILSSARVGATPSVGGNGYRYRAAWAGTGDGVLVIDADCDGRISGRREVVLTDWDPSAGTDMEALRQVFDTNRDGLLDAGDARLQQLKVAVTQADGTVVLKSLDELGIRSLTLTADETHREFEDGSSIDGEAIYTRTDGSTGKTATATLAIDAQGYAVTETVTTDAAGATTVSVRALGGDGSLASATTRTTSADGRTVVTRSAHTTRRSKPVALFAYKVNRRVAEKHRHRAIPHRRSWWVAA